MRQPLTTTTLGIVSLLAVLAAAPVSARDSIETRLQRIETTLDRQGLADLYLGQEELRKEVQRLRGEIEEQAYQIKGLKQRQQELYLDIDRRLRRLEGGGAAAAPPPTAPAPAATPDAGQAAALSGTAPRQPAPLPAAPVSDDEQTAYKTAFNYLKEGRYKDAIGGFRGFLQKFPNSSYAVNAQYWLGEAFYVNGNFSEAIGEFQKVLDKYPGSQKIPDTLLKIGYCHYEMKDNSKARQVLSDLKSRFPGTTAARLAENRLQRMKLEGR